MAQPEPQQPQTRSSVLFVVSGAAAVPMTDGSSMAAGFWAGEFAVPARALLALGFTVDVATPGGAVPVPDTHSLSSGQSQHSLQQEFPALLHPLVLEDIDPTAAFDVGGAAALIIPGGYSPMVDLRSSAVLSAPLLVWWSRKADCDRLNLPRPVRVPQHAGGGRGVAVQRSPNDRLHGRRGSELAEGQGVSSAVDGPISARRRRRGLPALAWAVAIGGCGGQSAESSDGAVLTIDAGVDAGYPGGAVTELNERPIDSWSFCRTSPVVVKLIYKSISVFT